MSAMNIAAVPIRAFRTAIVHVRTLNGLYDRFYDVRVPVEDTLEFIAAKFVAGAAGTQGIQKEVVGATVEVDGWPFKVVDYTYPGDITLHPMGS